MARYEIEYTELNSPATIEKAIADCKRWLGNRQFKKVVKLLREDRQQSSRYMVTLGLAFQGIEGYPAEVMIDTYWSRPDA